MGAHLEQQKQEKKQNLLQSAYALFMEKGVVKTSIDEIVQKANVAKGTFYLYFKDKKEILAALVEKNSYTILNEAYLYARAHDTNDFVKNVIHFADYIVEYFKRNKLVLKLLERNFSWPTFEEGFKSSGDPLFRELMLALNASPFMKKHSPEEAFRLIFVLVEMCGSVCYASIIEERPGNIDQMKPILYDIIRKALQ